MRRVRTWVTQLGLVGAGLAIGVLVGHSLFDEASQPKPSRISNTVPSTPSVPPAIESSPVAVSVRLEKSAPYQFWSLTAPESLARRKPPDSIKDCQDLFLWELTQGAVPNTDVVYGLVVKARRDTNIALLDVEATPANRANWINAPWAQVSCKPAGTIRDLPLNPSVIGVLVTPKKHLSADEVPQLKALPVDNSPYYRDPLALRSGQFIMQKFLPEPVEQHESYYYKVVVRLKVDGNEKTFEVDVAGQPFRYQSLFAGAGGGRPSYEWSFSPDPTFEYCPQKNDITALECYRVRPR